MDNSEFTQLNYCFNCMRRLEADQTVCPDCGYDSSVRRNPENTLPEGSILDGKYLVGKVLGQGGFGITYLGIDLTLSVSAAIKEYFPAGVAMRSSDSIQVTPVSSQTGQEGFKKGCQEFQTEARTLAQFDSPNIVHVRNFFEENGTAYIVMDYIVGKNLTAALSDQGGRMPWEQVVSLFKPLILEMEKLHGEHLIHRDIKPDNIYLEKDAKSGEDRLILLDFGSARRFVSENITKTYSAMVTPGFAPIEQYAAKSRQGPYTDVYAMCATMYALIAGRKPASAMDLSVGADRIEPFSELGIPVPEEVERAIMHGLAVRGEDRPQTMQQLYDELTGAAAVPEKTAEGSPLPAEAPEVKAADESPETAAVPEQKDEPGKAPKAAAGKRKWWILPLAAAAVLALILLLRPHGGSVQDDPTQTLTVPAMQQTEIPETQTAEPAASATSSDTSVDVPVPADTSSPTAADTSEPVNPPLPTAADTLMPSDTALPTDTLTPTDTPLPTATDTLIPTATDTPVPTNTPETAWLRNVKTGDIITFGRYEQDDVPGNGSEPIEWQVLTVENGRALVISRYALETMQYNDVFGVVTWEICTLRQWLNGDFYDTAFSDAEKSRIVEVLNNNPDNQPIPEAPSVIAKGGNPTNDRVFLLDVNEAEAYFPDDASRICTATDHAIAYAQAVSGTSYNDTEKAIWLLRTPSECGNFCFCASTVDTMGAVNAMGGICTDFSGSAVRPAFWLDLSEAPVPAEVNTPVPEPTSTPDPADPVKAGDVVKFGLYEQDNDLTNGMEPIEWQVLAVENHRALLISRYVLDVKQYDDYATSGGLINYDQATIRTTWETCTLRKWLNQDFYDLAFSSGEKQKIAETVLSNPDNPVYGTEGGNDTTDSIFLLSIQDAFLYFSNDLQRKCTATAFAAAHGAYVDSNLGTTWWWLRSPGFREDMVAIVNITGEVNQRDGVQVGIAGSSVRPAFWMELSAPDTSGPASAGTAADTPQPAASDTASDIPQPAAADTPRQVISAAVGEVKSFGSYEQDNDLTNGAEAIEWQVLAVEDGRALLISRYALDAKAFSESETAVLWENSTLRAWLNADFFEGAFGSEEKSRVLQVTNRNPDNASYGTKGGSDTADRVFLLTIDEADAYFEGNGGRKCEATAFAKANGAYIGSGATRWWLRSPGEGSANAAFVSTGGAVFARGDVVTRETCVVRPAFWLNLMESPAVTESGETPVPSPSAVSEPAETVLPTPTLTPAAAAEAIDLAVGDTYFFGRYEQDNVPDNGPEPIEWQVLDVQDDQALLISRYALDTKKFNHTPEIITWELSPLRTWMNEDFFNAAFSPEEQGRIISVMNENPGYENMGGTKGGNPTLDKVFFLSRGEVTEYFPSPEDRTCTATAYAKSTGAQTYDYDWLTNEQLKYKGNTEWWLRSTDSTVWPTGLIYGWARAHGWYDEGNGDVAIRPVFWLDLSAEGNSGSKIRELPQPTATRTPDPSAPVRVGEIVQFGSYEQDNVLSNGREPIEWLVLDVEEGRALLLSRYVLELKAYNETRTDVFWEGCSLRKWLNEDFYNTAFSSDERSQIRLVTNARNGNIAYDINGGGNPTNDRIFLLSMELFYNYFEKNKDQRCEGTEYVNSKLADRTNTVIVWWLRTPGEFYSRALSVTAIGTSGVDVNWEQGGVRPAFWLNF